MVGLEEDTARFIVGDEIVVFEEDIADHLDLLHQLHYGGGYHHLLRRADGNSVISLVPGATAPTPHARHFRLALRIPWESIAAVWVSFDGLSGLVCRINQHLCNCPSPSGLTHADS